jgi:hypothetical protein
MVRRSVWRAKALYAGRLVRSAAWGGKAELGVEPNELKKIGILDYVRGSFCGEEKRRMSPIAATRPAATMMLMPVALNLVTGSLASVFCFHGTFQSGWCFS